jgi:hypothetical protein
MFVFEFDAGLLQFRLKSPACEPLLQLPPLVAIARTADADRNALAVRL